MLHTHSRRRRLSARRRRRQIFTQHFSSWIFQGRCDAQQQVACFFFSRRLFRFVVCVVRACVNMLVATHKHKHMRTHIWARMCMYLWVWLYFSCLPHGYRVLYRTTVWNMNYVYIIKNLAASVGWTFEPIVFTFMYSASDDIRLLCERKTGLLL